MPRAFEPYHELCMRCGCILSCFNFGILPNLTLGAMFPGRWPTYPESMWNYGWSTPSFSSPQPAVPPGQFCGSDMMSIDEPTVTSSVSSSDSGATGSSQGAKLHFESTTCVTSSNSYPTSPTTSSIPPIHFTSTSVYTHSTGTTNTGCNSIHTTRTQRTLQRRRDDATDEE